MDSKKNLDRLGYTVAYLEHASIVKFTESGEFNESCMGKNMIEYWSFVTQNDTNT